MPIPQIPAPNINRIPKPIQSKEPIKEMINSQNQSRLTHNRDSQDYRFYNQITEAQSQMQSSGYNFQPNILLERQNKIINPKGQLNDSGRGANENPYEGFFHLRNTPKKVVNIL